LRTLKSFENFPGSSLTGRTLALTNCPDDTQEPLDLTGGASRRRELRDDFSRRGTQRRVF
jgi:hypothetical protein